MTLNIVLAVFILGISFCWARWAATSGSLIAFPVPSYGSIASGLIPDYVMNHLARDNFRRRNESAQPLATAGHFFALIEELRRIEKNILVT